MKKKNPFDPMLLNKNEAEWFANYLEGKIKVSESKTQKDVLESVKGKKLEEICVE